MVFGLKLAAVISTLFLESEAKNVIESVLGRVKRIELRSGPKGFSQRLIHAPNPGRRNRRPFFSTSRRESSGA